jgi:endonuclease/exonuclease/phosphatase family metal-dependent hydrolase
MNQAIWADGRPALQAFASLNALLGEARYTEARQRRMITLLEELGLQRADTGPFVVLRRNRGSLLRRPRSGGLDIVANGRADWAGSLELRDEPVTEKAMQNTACVMAELQADVLGVVEVESRPVLAAFNSEVIAALGGVPFRHAMVIDGNDERGIDVGLLTREAFPVGRMRSHVDDRLPDGGLIFSRDCPEFEVMTPSGERLFVLVNHFKSKGYGCTAASNARRHAQAERVAAIYRNLVEEGASFVAVVGDLNDTPGSRALEPLLASTDLRDAFSHPGFDNGGFPGTYGLCNAANKIDYLLLSPALFDRATSGGILRRGMWPGSRPARWATFPELVKPEDAGSDHVAIWVDIDL